MNKSKTILIVAGTRPEAIKLAPLYWQLKKDWQGRVLFCSTGQHDEMLKQVLVFFDIVPDFELGVMREKQNLAGLTSRILNDLTPVFAENSPDVVVVQGDTTTAFAAALAAFYQQIFICHVEAGLRTTDIYSPFPEEMNRRMVTCLASTHFAPTRKARENLLREGVSGNQIFVTGNTGIDALMLARERIQNQHEAIVSLCRGHGVTVDSAKRLLLITLHRRENIDSRLEIICRAIVKILICHPDVQVIFPMHKNPAVREIVKGVLGGVEGVSLVEPLEYKLFVWLMGQAFLIISDSGGIQEEAPSLGCPVLVARESTERPEAVGAGNCYLVGSDGAKIVRIVGELLDNSEAYTAMSTPRHIYGDGRACLRIVKCLSEGACEEFE